MSRHENPAGPETWESLRREAEDLARRKPSRLPHFYRKLEERSVYSDEDRVWMDWIIGSTQQLNGHTAKALERLRRASRIFRRRGQIQLAARVDLSLMDALACQGKHQAAGRRGRRALEDFRKLGDEGRTVSALLNLGGLEEARDRISRAMVYWLEARKSVSARDARRRGLIETSIGGGFEEQGRFRDAEKAYLNALDLLRDSGDLMTRSLPKLGLARIAALRGNPGRALVMLSEIEGEVLERGDENLLAATRLIKADIEVDIGHGDRALEEAVEMGARALAAGRKDDEARFAAIEARAALAQKIPDHEQRILRAVKLLDATLSSRASAEFRARLGFRYPHFSRSRLSKDADLLEKSGLSIPAELARASAAEAAYHEGQENAARRLAGEILKRRNVSPWSAIRARRLCSRLDEKKNPLRALRHLRSLLRIAESIRGRLSSRRDREFYTTELSGDYERLVRILLRRGDTRSRRSAFEAVARVKSRGLVEALDRNSDQILAEDPELSSRWEDLREELAAMLAALEGSSYGEGRFTGGTLKKRVHRISRELEDLEIEASRKKPVLRAVLFEEDAPPLGSLLGKGEIFLEYFFSGEDLVLFVLDERRLDIQIIPGCRKACERDVEEVRFQLSRVAYGRDFLEAAEIPLLRSISSRLQHLGKLLLAPLGGRNDISRLWIAPHAFLHHIPMAALEFEGRVLIERCPVALVPGSDVLRKILMRAHHCPERLGVAGAQSSGLPEIDVEIEEISRCFENVEILSGAGTVEVQEMLLRCDAVHIASHGAFHASAPASSGFRLRDGWLTAADLLRKPPCARMMTCGVCASGEVEVRPGEETMGVIRALMAGGVSTALLAPGVLDDRIARKAARFFYGEVFRSDPGSALQKTLLSLRQEHPHPALWAALQLYGNSRPWEKTQ